MNPFSPAVDLLRLLATYRKALTGATRAEFDKRYAGSLFGRLWIALHPALLLSIYLFVYLAVFKMRFPGQGPLYYVVFVFCGLVPYIGFMESVTAGCTVVKQNIHLIKNVLVPIEILPVRTVLVSMVTQAVSLVILLGLAGLAGTLSWHLLWLPAVFVLQMLLLTGVVLVLACLGSFLPDVGYFVNLAVLLLIFISPIGFTRDMIPPDLLPVLYLNPIAYLIEVYRDSILYGRVPDFTTLAVYPTMSILAFLFGAGFFRRFKDTLVDLD